MGRKKLGCAVTVDEPITAALKRHTIRDRCGADAGDGSCHLEHLLLQQQHLRAGVAGHPEIGLRKGNAIRLKAERDMQNAVEPSNSNQRCSDQQRADGNLDDQQQIAQREAANGFSLQRAALDGVDNIRPLDLPGWEKPEEEAARNRQEECRTVNPQIGRDQKAGGEISEGLPVTQGA